MLNDLLLLSGNDIPFIQAQISIHQPTIKEIAYIGEEMFFLGCELLNFSKNILSEEDKINLENKSNFEVFMSIMRDNNKALQENRLAVMMVLTLLFPEYRIGMQSDCIVFERDNEEPHYLNAKNFEAFKEILVEMFCLKLNKDSNAVNPSGQRAREIAEKLRKGREKAAAAKGEKTKLNLFSRYVSILAVAQQKSINSLLSYTVYQLFDEYKRYELKYTYDITIQMKLAGAKDVQEAENWMQDIHAAS